MIVISFNKRSAAFVSALIILIGAVLFRESTKSANNSQIIIIENPHETSSSQTLKTVSATVNTTKTTVVFEKIISENSTYFTNLSVKSTEISSTYTETVDLYIDINNADFDELVKLNGIGEYLAEQIITYREENGGFNNIEEIINVSGIGEKTFDLICDFIYVENPVYYSQEIYDEPSQPVDVVGDMTSEEVTEVPLTLEDCIPINLNEADIEILVLLPYVNDEIARNIIEFRTETGGFSHIYELLHIEGITEEILTEIVKYVYV